MPLPIFLPCKKGYFYIDYIVSIWKEKGKNYESGKNTKKKVCSTSVLVYGRFNYWVLSVRAVVTID